MKFEISFCMKNDLINDCRYSWCSDRLIKDKFIYGIRQARQRDLIPMEASRDTPPDQTDWKPRFIVGHNVSYDRSYIREQYFIKV